LAAKKKKAKSIHPAKAGDQIFVLSEAKTDGNSSSEYQFRTQCADILCFNHSPYSPFLIGLLEDLQKFTSLPDNSSFNAWVSCSMSHFKEMMLKLPTDKSPRLHPGDLHSKCSQFRKERHLETWGKKTTVQGARRLCEDSHQSVASKQRMMKIFKEI